MKRMRFLLIMALCLILAMAPAVRANSGPSQWEGGTGSGMAVKGDDCPIVVDHEMLTFDIQEFPREYYDAASDFWSYGATVTAQYTFRNPTEETVTATLLFPFGDKPQYVAESNLDYPVEREAEMEQYGVTVNGEAVDVTLRGSLFYYGEEFEMGKDLAKLHDGYVADPFYSPELTVTQYFYEVSGVDHETYASAFAAADLALDGTKTKVLFTDFNGGRTMDGFIRVGGFLDDGEGGAADLIFYVIGEQLPEELTWTVYENAECETVIDGTAKLIRSETMTFEDVALRVYRESSAISQTDWYNAFVADLNRNEWSYGVIGPDVQWKIDRYVMRWYEYEIAIGPGETLTNTVTAPIYPGIHTGYEPPIYDYTYLLSPAQGWAEFGSLDIVINTPFHMYQCNLEGFEDTEEGYALHLEGLPDQELAFILSSDANPAKPGTHVRTVGWVIAGAVVLVAAGLLLRRKRK